MSGWYKDAVFYSIYPLGAVNTKRENDYGAPGEGIAKLGAWVEHIAGLGCNAVYFAPVFQSKTHGYDTTDYRVIDSRLGTNDQFAQLVAQCHSAGLRVVVDGVFNHTGRDFFAFRDLQKHREGSQYRDWYQGLSFHTFSPLGDPFTYEAWRGHFELPRLDPACAAVRQYLYDTVRMWIREFDIDGIRLDCADCLDDRFMKELRGICTQEKQDFWLMGEIIHGDYTRWANKDTLHSVTNYECYKGLYSSHNDGNLHEIAYSLNRQFGSGGIYKDLILYNFADNHDVNRLADSVKREAFLYTIYTLLYTMPGMPSVYYGSEWGMHGVTDRVTDWNLRPTVDIETVHFDLPQLMAHIRALGAVRKSSPAIRGGTYEQLIVSSHQLAFRRSCEGEEIIAAINVADREETISLPSDRPLEDLLHPGEIFGPDRETDRLDVPIPAFGSRILRPIAPEKRGVPASMPLAEFMPASPSEPAPVPIPAPVIPPQPQPLSPPQQQPEETGVQVVRMETLAPKQVEKHSAFTHQRRTAFQTQRLIVAFYELPPGKSAYPYHWHTGREEVFYILEGSGLLRTPQGERQVSAGDLVYFPPDPSGAHRLINTTHLPLRYIDFDALVKGDACLYPDSGKVNLGGGQIHRLGDSASYYDGE